MSGVAIALGLVLQLQAGDLATFDGRCGRISYIDRGAGVPMVWLDPVPLGDPPRGYIRAPLAQLAPGCSPLPINDETTCPRKSSAPVGAPFARARKRASDSQQSSWPTFTATRVTSNASREAT